MGYVRRLHGKRPQLRRKPRRRLTCLHCGYVFREYHLISMLFEVVKVCPKCFRRVQPRRHI